MMTEYAVTEGQEMPCVPGAGFSQRSNDRLPLFVVATTDKGTRAALRAAGTLGRQLEGEVILLALEVVPYPLPLENPRISTAFKADRFRRMGTVCGADLSVRICVCRAGEPTWEQLLPRDAIVLIGGCRRRWRRSREERLADHLLTSGHRVVFVPSDNPSTTSR